MRLGVFLVVSLFCSRSLAGPWDPFTDSGSGDGFTPIASTTTTSHPADSRAPDTRWYGELILGVDAASLALFAAAIPTKRPEPLLLGLGGYLVGAPVIHGAHDHGVIAMPDLGLRLGMFATGAQVGASVTRGEDFSTRWDATLGGALLGAVIASGIDIAVFAWRPERPLSVQPVLSIHEQSAGVGAAGAF